MLELKKNEQKYSGIHFDVVQWHVIDPMHNIFLGIAKHAFKTWKDLNIISTTAQCEAIQTRVDMINTPPRLGRIVRKIDSGFASLTTNDWILLYSLHALYRICQMKIFAYLLKLVESYFCQLLQSGKLKNLMI